jgi:NADH-quinone oxidoreductase subunit N
MLLLATTGLMLLVGSEELLMIFIALELTGLSLYVMTGFDKADLRSAEASLKYFLFGSTASAFTLFGISLVYGMSGVTGLAAIGQKLAAGPVPPLLAVGIVMTLVGFAFKIAAAPFHLWAPDAYQGGPVPSAAFIASGSKVASFVVLGKIVLVGFGPLRGSAAWHALVAGWSPVLATLAALSIVVGNFVALVQSNVRRLLAYSAVAHAGYTLLGLIAAGREGFAATLFYTTTYGLTLVGAFAVVALVRRETGGDDFSHFAGLRLRSPMLAACMAVFPGRDTATRRIFWKILCLQRCDARRGKPGATVAGRARAFWQLHFALLLPDCAQNDFLRRKARERIEHPHRHITMADADASRRGRHFHRRHTSQFAVADSCRFALRCLILSLIA